MADNVTFDVSLAGPPIGTIVSTEEVTTLNGGAVTAQQAQRMILALRTADATAVDLPGDSANGLDVDLTRIASGASADIGAVADAAIITDTTGSLSGKLRGLVKWAFERMPASLGQKAKTASLPVVIASDQDALAVTMASVPTGGATEATLATRLSESDFDTKVGALTETAPATDTASSGLNGRLQRIAQRLTSLIALLPTSLGQKAMTASLPVVIASDQSAIAVSMAAVPTGGATAANQSTIIGHVDGLEGLLTTIDADTGTIAGAVAGSEMQVDIVGALPAGTNNIGDVDIASIAAGDNNIGNVDIVTLPALPAGTNNIGDVDVLTLPALPAGANNIGDVDIASIAAGDNNIGNVDVVTLPALPAGTNNIGDVDVLTLPAITGTVTANAGTGTFATKETRASSSAVTSVNDTASSTTLLAANANRLGATVYNDSTVALYLKLGATASLTSFTVKMAADSYYEVPFAYTGIIDGIWASDASGSARITEITV